jgi:hypothetical protein
MPVYKNETDAPITPISGVTYLPNEQKTSIEYYQNPNGLTLVSHAPAGSTGTVLYSDAPPASEAIEVFSYDSFVVINRSGADVTVIPNTDSDNGRVVPKDGILAIDNTSPRIWHSITITGSGSGSVDVVAGV